jgi:hypothetical protein
VPLKKGPSDSRSTELPLDQVILQPKPLAMRATFRVQKKTITGGNVFPAEAQEPALIAAVNAFRDEEFGGSAISTR